jgi:hypothetical protein
MMSMVKQDNQTLRKGSMPKIQIFVRDVKSIMSIKRV